jgi:hypothetical protein
VRKQAQSSHCRINIQPCGEAGSNNYRQNLVAGEGKHFLRGTKKKKAAEAAFYFN